MRRASAPFHLPDQRVEQPVRKFSLLHEPAACTAAFGVVQRDGVGIPRKAYAGCGNIVGGNEVEPLARELVLRVALEFRVSAAKPMST